MTSKLGMTVDLCMAYNYARARFDDLTLTLMQGHSGSAKAKISVELPRQLSKQ